VNGAHFGRSGHVPHSSNARACPSAAPSAGSRATQASAAPAGSSSRAAIADEARGPVSAIAKAWNVA